MLVGFRKIKNIVEMNQELLIRLLFLNILTLFAQKVFKQFRVTGSSLRNIRINRFFFAICLLSVLLSIQTLKRTKSRYDWLKF